MPTTHPNSPSRLFTHGLGRSPLGKRKERTLADFWGSKVVGQRLELSRPEPHPAIATTDTDQLLVVDLFCGCGGFSTGAEQAGHRVVLAVDCDRAALAYHRANHRQCTHVRMLIGPGTEDRLLRLIRESVPPGRKWHMHGSPPCQLFSTMRNASKGMRKDGGMQLVQWYVKFALAANPSSWTFENVRSPPIAAFMREAGVAFGYFNFVSYGVPQTRKRCLAGSSSIIHNFKHDCSLRVYSLQSPWHVLSPPPRATMIRASGGKCTAKFYRSVTEPTWALLCACKPVYVTEDNVTLRVLTVRELLRLQTFPDSYRMSSTGHFSLLGTEADRVRLVGNAVPPIIAKKMMQAAGSA